jgi:hypothetical protein
MDSTINPAGFQIWSPTDPRNETIFYAEAGSHGEFPTCYSLCWILIRHGGPGFNASTRVFFDHLLSAREAKKDFSVGKIFGGIPHWVDWQF